MPTPTALCRPLLALAILAFLTATGCSPAHDAPVKTAATTSDAAPPTQPPPAPSTPETTMATNPTPTTPNPTPSAKLTKSEDDWKKTLTPEQYRILRQKGTERSFSGEFWNTPASTGEYRCAACDALLFKGSDKFVSDCGWPAFDKAIKGSIEYHTDRSFGMLRTEVTCAACDGHLGHVFEDGPTDTSTRYCINSVSIKYVKDGAASKDLPTEAIVEAPKK